MFCPKETPYRNPKILRAAKDEPCTMNSPECSYNNEESCFRHLNESYAGKAKGLKADDFAGFIGCLGCENWYALSTTVSKEEKAWYVLRAVIRTLRILFNKDVIK